MYYYDNGDHLILKIVILTGTLSLILFIFNWIMRKLLNVERQKWFSNHYVNDTHKKYDKRIRVISVIAYLIAMFYLIADSSNFGMETSWYLFVVGMVIMAVQELIRAYMEWKYLKDKNNYLFTLIQLIFIIATVVVVFRSDFFGMFNL
ncbi:DUF4181 domain-containing protein [Oceanobacillus longus]|uniref:DUF4181 domain-containing protein n=1 Tax=Oceanobacillus longus TaxID=930120 RepID=A0ABV8GUV7_9BACI